MSGTTPQSFLACVRMPAFDLRQQRRSDGGGLFREVDRGRPESSSKLSSAVWHTDRISPLSKLAEVASPAAFKPVQFRAEVNTGTAPRIIVRGMSFHLISLYGAASWSLSPISLEAGSTAVVTATFPLASDHSREQQAAQQESPIGRTV